MGRFFKNSTWCLLESIVWLHSTNGRAGTMSLKALVLLHKASLCYYLTLPYSKVISGFQEQGGSRCQPLHVSA